MPPLSLAFARYTSCSGCQLMLLNCEAQLATLAELATCRDFPLLSSAAQPELPVTLALVEGAISTPAELTELLALRERALLLVAVGACALSGGVNALAPPAGADTPRGTFPPLPVAQFVRVDWQLPGCPPERSDFVKLLTALYHGGWPGELAGAVCLECRIREYRCLLQEDRQPCLGPLTRAGCAARCPGRGTACEGCRGEAAAAERDVMLRLLVEQGLGPREARRRLARFRGGLA